MFFKNMIVGEHTSILFQPISTTQGLILVSRIGKKKPDWALKLNMDNLLVIQENIDWLIGQMIKIEKLQCDNPIEYEYLSHQEEEEC